jgi:hypothetical protein
MREIENLLQQSKIESLKAIELQKQIRKFRSSKMSIKSLKKIEILMSPQLGGQLQARKAIFEAIQTPLIKN